MDPRQARELIFSGTLPPGTTVEGSLYLERCTSLQSLPNDLKVGGWLNLYGCTSLQSLPYGMMVGGWLNLRGCTSLQSLPDGLKVEGSLYLERCTSLQLPKGIPEGVQGEVYIDEEVLRNNKEHLLMLVNCRFYEESKELYKKILAEG